LAEISFDPKIGEMDVHEIPGVDQPPANNKKRKDLTCEETRQIVRLLLLEGKEGPLGPLGEQRNPKLKHGALAKVAGVFGVVSSTASRIWKKALNNSFRASPKKKGRVGLAVKWDREELRQAILLVPTHRRKTIRKLASALGMAKSTLHVMKQCKIDCAIVPHSNAIKPHLTEENLMTRLMYAGEHVDNTTGYYYSLYLTIHVDEKWFFISEENLHMYLVPGEKAPNRKCRHKSHVIKVMFLAALAKPRYDAAGKCTFDGKIGMWPFIKQVEAQRDSVNRPAGTIETKCVTVTKANS
jgi:transposase-like protein